MMQKSRRSKGEGTLIRRADGRYEGRVSLGTVDGKRVRKSIYGRNRLEVVRGVREILARHRFNVTTVYLREYLLQWLQDGRSRWEPQTFRTYRAIISNHVIPRLGDFRIATLTPIEIRAWMRHLEELQVGANTRRRALAILRSALKQLYAVPTREAPYLLER